MSIKQITNWFSSRQCAQFNNTSLIWLTAVGLLLTMVATACQVPGTQEATTTCSSTGLCVAERFQTFYHENGGERVLGLPHREAYTDEATGRTVQYFDNVRLEYDPTTDEVIVTKLGSWALEPLADDRPEILPATEPVMEDAFDDFYIANNGEIILGRPLTNQIEEGQLRVQYFENGRLEWHPEAQVGRQVQLTPLGQSHFILEAPNSGFDVLAMPEVRAQSADVTAAVSAPILYRGDDQILYVIAEDANNGHPLSGLSVRVEMTFSDGTSSQTQVIEELTNSLGLTQTELDLPELAPGTEVQVQVEVAYPDENDPIGGTIITFQTWW